MLVVGPLRRLLPPLLAEDLGVIRIVFYEDEEGGEETVDPTEEECDVPKVAGNVGGGGWSNLATAGDNKGERE